MRTLAVVTVALTAAAVWLAAGHAALNDLGHVPFVLACAVTGGLLARHRAGGPIGPLLLGGALSFALLDFCGHLAIRTGNAALAWPQTWLWVPANALLAAVPVFFPDGKRRDVLFPDGKRRGRAGLIVPGLIVLGVLGAAAAITGAIRPGPNGQVGPGGLPNPLGVDGLAPVADLAGTVFTVYAGLLFVVAGAVAAARGVFRQQVKWVAYALAVAILVVLGRLVAGLTDADPAVWPAGSLAWDLAGGLATAAIPVALAIAILRHRLFDIDLIISRTAVYLGLSVTVAGAYLLVVGVLGSRASLLGAVAAAVLFAPVRAWLQRRVNILVYGERDDPYAALSRLGHRLEQVQDPAALLATGVAAVREALQLSYAGIEVTGAGSHETGVRPATPVVLPLVAAGEPAGVLRLGPRPGESALSRRDLRLLTDLARQLAVAAAAARSAADLRRSRERLVVAREEERRRLRRDLHDGLGPTLAGLTMRAEAARELAADRPAAVGLLDEIVGDARTAVADVRRLVDGLRPPALDTLGLAGALAAHVAGRPDSAIVRFTPPPDLPPLGAATEVAAYRIAVEALTNASRHAAAHSVHLGLAVEPGCLIVEVSDDGQGIGAAGEAGVGLHSMRERAEELGGTLTIATDGRGTTVRAELPLEG